VGPVENIVGPERGIGVGGEHHVEFGTLGGLRRVHKAFDPNAPVGSDARMTPRRHVMTAAFDEQAEFHHRSRGSVVHGSIPHAGNLEQCPAILPLMRYRLDPCLPR